MRKSFLTLMAVIALGLSAYAGEMGWTLDQCRQHFGSECGVDGVTYRFHLGPWGPPVPQEPYSAEHYYRSVDHTFGNPATSRLVEFTLDPDGTVGKIVWMKAFNGFPEAEVQQHLREASGVNWERTGPDENGFVSWVGKQHGKIIFNATESDNGRGTWFLEITTH
jgi:hypothetical protein